VRGLQALLLAFVAWFVWLGTQDHWPINPGAQPYLRNGIPESYFWAAAGLTVVTVLLHLIALRGGIAGTTTGPRRGMYYLVIGEDGRVSTSKLQLVLWTYAVAYVFLSAIVQGVDVITMATIQTQYLFLLGIPAAGAAGASLITSQKVESGQLAKPSVEDTGGEKAVTDPPGPIQGLGQVVTDDQGRGDIGDFQYFIFNLVALAFFFEKLFTSGVANLPVIPDTLVALTGASALAYLTKKGVVSDAPLITTIFPARAAAGSIVHIRGQHFGSTGSATGLVVLFGGIPATAVDVQTSTSLDATVPDVGGDKTLDVVVSTAEGLQTDPFPFTVESPKPTLTSVRPKRIIVDRDASLTIDGRSFLPQRDANHQASVTLGGRVMQVTTASEDRLVIAIPGKADLGLTLGQQELIAVDSLGRESDPVTVELVAGSD
jgi:hypothetical protein